ncbi:uncharacterized protein LOC100891954 [Strongylocentrotus purpuratus]|uniref:Uncharacterized protein n=1 Tax=Strongylocentrotus purpuratus TaxID=7668 RepID=A0A7M7HPD0_STRPU|nr:uncharacterized protein LOC100891954 [Strongylocentrotus purpuratus]|eukprot:XP_011673956.1 PREDICTED: uncharacterized protein LOC100891954 [Strongylocentrotus purpuratus]
MKKSILFVSGTLWAFSVFVGKSCPSAIYPLNSDDSNDGAILEKNSNKLDLPRDMSQPIIARFARDVTGEDPKVPIHLLIIIIPVVMGIVVIIIIVLVVCYMCRRSERGTCISNEWLIWCGLTKRSNDSSVRDPGDHRSAIASDAPSDRRGVRYEPRQNAMSPTHDESDDRLLTDTPQRVEREDHTGACPSEWSPNTIPGTPNTGKSSLQTDDEWSPHSRNTDTVHQSGTPKFTFQGNEKTDDGRDNGKADRSGSEDDVFKPGIDGVSDTGSKDIGPGRKRKGACASGAGADEDTVTRDNQSPILVNNLPHGSDSMDSHHVEEDEPEMERLLPNEQNYTRSKVSHGHLSNQEWQRKFPSSAPPGDTHRDIRGKNVFLIVSGNAQVGFYNHVEDVQVGNREIHVNNNYLPQDVTNSRHDTGAFNRSSSERQTR